MKLQAIINKARDARKADPGDVKPFPPGWEERFTIGQLERLAVRTVDGCMTDAAALKAEGLKL